MKKALDKKFDDIKLNDSAFFERLITKDDLIKFADISGDYNPLHLDEKYALGTVFKNKIAHGMFLGALVSRLVGMELPGKRALLIKECLEFKKPARIGEKILVTGRVIHKSQALHLVELSIIISRNKEILVSGSAHIRVLK